MEQLIAINKFLTGLADGLKGLPKPRLRNAGIEAQVGHKFGVTTRSFLEEEDGDYSTLDLEALTGLVHSWAVGMVDGLEGLAGK